MGAKESQRDRESQLMQQLEETRQNLIRKEEELSVIKQDYRELSHRVANELQQIEALAKSRQRDAGNPDFCSRCVARVDGLIALHRLLGDAGPAIVPMDVYLPAIGGVLERSFGRGIRIAVAASSEMALGAERANIVGLIVNEAVLNAHKHAFPCGGGRVELKLRRRGRQFELTVRDNGNGFDGGNVVHGNGRRLMEGLANQLGGRLEYRPVARGTLLRVRFPA